MRQLQRRLWTAAKRSSTRRFHALYDRIHRSDVLWEAWKRVKRNKGAAGIDRETIEQIERSGVRELLDSIEFYRSRWMQVLRHLDRALVAWVCRKFRRFRRRERAATHWLGRVARRDPNLFAHWQLGVLPAVGAGGAG